VPAMNPKWVCGRKQPSRATERADRTSDSGACWNRALPRSARLFVDPGADVIRADRAPRRHGLRGRTKMSAGKPHVNVSTMSRINWLFLWVVIGN